jgi:hypothetical protein
MKNIFVLFSDFFVIHQSYQTRDLFSRNAIKQ